MKKFLLLLAASIGLVANAQEQQVGLVSASFINNGTYLILSNNVAYNYGTASNVIFAPYSYGTNLLALGGATVGSNTAAFVEANGFADANGQINSNATISVTIGISTNYPLPAPIRRWPSRADMGTNIPSALIGAPTAASTNAVTFVFVRSGDGVNFGTGAGDKFTFVATATGTTPLTLVTNLPAWFCVGSAKYRLLSATPDNSTASPGVIINALNLNHWGP